MLPPESPRRVPMPVQLLLGLFLACGIWGVATIAGASNAGAVITGIDVASYQHPNGQPIDWPRVAAAGHKFAYVKATQATSYVNPYFAADWRGIDAAGLLRGAYHFAIPNRPVIDDARAEARYFVSVVGSMNGPNDLPPELDLEYNPYDSAQKCYGLSQSEFATWARTWADEVFALTGRKAVVYTGQSYWQTCSGNSTILSSAGYRLYVANYHCLDFDGSHWCDPERDTFQPPGFSGWGSWTFWQNYSWGSVPGITGDVDMNRFCCDLASLRALTGTGAAGGSPFGSIDRITPLGGGRFTVEGWAIDPDVSSPIQVHVYPGEAGPGVTGTATTANVTRLDVGAAYPGFGSAHGYSATLTASSGTSKACAYGINTGSGANSLLGCLDVGSPFGYFDVLDSPAPGRIRVGGWLKDPDGDAAVRYTVVVDDRTFDLTADLYRSDVGAHGFAAVLDVGGGRHQVSVIAHNAAGPGGDITIICTVNGGAIDLPTGSPVGSADLLEGGVGGVRVGGWAIDPDTASSIPVHVYVDGVGTALTADASRTDLLSVPYLAPYGADHGFAATVAATPGRHRVCVYGIETSGKGANTELACRQVFVYGHDPAGVLAAAKGRTNSVDVAGWAIDPDTNSAIPVHVYIDGTGVALTAGVTWTTPTDYGPYGADHWFSRKGIPARPGLHDVCAYGINAAGDGTNVLLGCRLVYVNSGAPFGNLEAVQRVDAYGVVVVKGWAIDPKVTTASAVHIYVNGRFATSTTANLVRNDLDVTFGYGPRHGFTSVVPMVGRGTQTVCAYAIDSARPGTNTLLGCRSV